MGCVLIEVTPVAKGPRPSRVTLRGHAVCGMFTSPDDQSQSFFYDTVFGSCLGVPSVL